MTATPQPKTIAERQSEAAAKMAELAEAGRAELRERIRSFLEPRGNERVIDVGAGTGAFALAVAPLVREVVAVEKDPTLVAEGRLRGAELENVTFVEGDAAHLPFEAGSFDVAAAVRTLHHVARPELVVAELARVTSLRGSLLIVDQIAPSDPLLGFELDRFERVRDPSHTRLLPDIDIRAFLEANGLVLRRSQFVQEQHDPEQCVDLAGCTGEARERALSLAPEGYTATVGWYLAAKQGPRS